MPDAQAGRRALLGGAGGLVTLAVLAPGDRTLPFVVWEDDFTGPSGRMPRHWQFDRTARAAAGRMTPANAALDGNGHFTLAARSTDHGYTCTQVYGTYPARVIAVGQFLEVRAKVPVSPGVWPALWTMGANSPHNGPGIPPATGWPACGEVDLLEVMYADSRERYSAHLHAPQAGQPSNWRIAQPVMTPGWHSYGVWFQHDSISLFYDTALIGVARKAARPPGSAGSSTNRSSP